MQLENELEFVETGFKKEEDQRKGLETELALLRLVEEDRNALKRKYN